MRTKTLLLTAALAAAGVATSMAQTAVYSVNIVGYINKTLPSPGLSLIANQLNATPNNGVQTLFGTPPGIITVFKFNGTGYDQASFDPDQGWTDPTNMSLSPGEGAFVDNATGAPLPLTFVGEVKLQSNNAFQGGLHVYSSVIPAAGHLDDLGLSTPTAIVTIYKFNGHGYDQTQFDPDTGWQTTDGKAPSVAVSEAFFVDNSGGPVPWPVDFKVGQ